MSRVEKFSDKDWTGNQQAVFAALGCNAKRNTEYRQCRDYYATDPISIDYLLKSETLNHRVLEPCAGGGHLVDALRRHGHEVVAFDIDPQAPGIARRDFLDELDVRGWDGDIATQPVCDFDGDIVTNPPYKTSREFIERSLSIVRDGAKVCMFLPIRYLASSSRLELFKKCPPKRIHVFSWRVKCARNGDFTVMDSSTVDYAWFVWVKGFVGRPEVDWFDREFVVDFSKAEGDGVK